MGQHHAKEERAAGSPRPSSDDSMEQHDAKEKRLVVGGSVALLLGLILAFMATDPGKDLYNFIKAEVFKAGGPKVVLDRNPDDIMGLPLGEYFYAFPIDIAVTLPPPADKQFVCDGMWQWAHDHGGQDSRESRFAFTIQAGTENVQVNKLDLDVTEVERATPAVEIMTCPMGDPTSGRFLTVDLDAKRAEFTTYPDPEESQADVEAAPFGLTIAPGQSERVLVLASATKNYRWHMTLHMIVGGEPRQFVLTDEHAQPFVTMGSPDPQAWHMWSGTAWVPNSD